ncbi:MAG TPA: hypothetical protein ENI62_15625 [Gammaproteobacteria bacterium]|nr:hypothetical protein [Gammaproteobacteria bacterium]
MSKALKRGCQGDGGGRKTIVFDESKIREIKKLGAILNVSQLSDYLQVSESTFRKIRERQPEVGTAYKKARAQAIFTIGQTLFTKAANGDVASMIFWMKTQAHWSEKNIIEVEETLCPTVIKLVGPDYKEDEDDDDLLLDQ